MAGNVSAIKVILDFLDRRMPEKIRKDISPDTAKDIGNSMAAIVKSVADDEISEERGEKLISMMRTRLEVYTAERLEIAVEEHEAKQACVIDEGG